MQTKVELFVNPHRFKEYAVKYRRHFWNRWKYVPNLKGGNAIFDKKTAEAVALEISSSDTLF